MEDPMNSSEPSVIRRFEVVPGEPDDPVAMSDLPRAGQLIDACWRLGSRLPDLIDEERVGWRAGYGRLRRWTHMLGFGSHFAIKSRHHLTTRVIGMLAFAAIGWHITADALLANTATGQA